MITVLFFGQLKEQLNCPKLCVELDAIAPKNTLNNLLILLQQQYPEWADHLQNNVILSAVNQSIVSTEHLIADGDEVAFFPPVTGG